MRLKISRGNLGTTNLRELTRIFWMFLWGSERFLVRSDWREGFRMRLKISRRDCELRLKISRGNFGLRIAAKDQPWEFGDREFALIGANYLEGSKQFLVISEQGVVDQGSRTKKELQLEFHLPNLLRLMH